MICTTTGVKTPSGTELNTSLLGRMGGRQKDPMQISHGPAALGLVVSMWSGLFFFLRCLLSGQCNGVHGTENPWASKSWDLTVTGEAGGRPWHCVLSGYLEKCSESGLLAISSFQAQNLVLPPSGSQVVHCLWLIASFDNHTVPCWGLCFSWVYPPLSTGSLWASAFKSIMLQRWLLFFSPSCPLYLSLSACMSIVANVVLEQSLWLLLNGIHSTLYESKSVPSSVMESVFRWLVRTFNYLEASGSRSALQAGFISGLWFASAFIWLCKILQPVELWVWGPLVSFAS